MKATGTKLFSLEKSEGIALVPDIFFIVGNKPDIEEDEANLTEQSSNKIFLNF